MTGTRLRLTFAALVATLTAIALAAPGVAAAAEFPLTIEFGGNGEGAVGCKVNSGPLEECEAEYEEGTEVSVVPEPELGSVFGTWEGECDTVVGEVCEVEILGAKTIEATFELEEFEVTVEAEGTGEGVVECQVDGGPYELCEEHETYPYGTELVLFAEPEPGSEFLEWGGDCAGIEAECELTVEEELSAVAIFKPEPPFELTIESGGSGEGIFECEVNGGDLEECEAEYEEGTEVNVIAEPEAGSEFVEWSGECDFITGVTENECEVEMNADKTVEAIFDLKPLETLTVTPAGTGTGTVQCKFNGGSAGACTSPQPNGTTVEIIATAASGSTFAGFSGGTGSATACSTSPCSFTIEANSAVTATFNLAAKFKLKVKRTGTGTGTVTSTPVGILCGGTCEHEFEEGKVVELKEIAEPGSAFAGWSGACSGSGACKVTMSSAKEVTAEFNLKPKFKLTVTKSGTGAGTVTSTAPNTGIACGATCSAEFESGKEVELSQSAASGSEFKEWSGACTGSGACKVTMSAAKTVGAVFNAQSSGGGGGSGSGSGGGGTGGGGGGTVAGTATAAATATVTSGKAALKLSCSGGPCSGSLTLTAKLKQGKKTKNLTIGRASFSLAAGASATLQVKLSGPAKQELAMGKTIKAKLGGSGIAARTVKLKPAKRKGGH